VIFHDSTLQQLARLQPGTHGALLQVPGVGEKKAESVGERVLAAIRTHRGGGPGA
jgi:superfamily II DNA helicase RecQ